jgi:hypothetical protein
MNTSTRSAVKFLLRVTAWLFFAVAGIAFWVGGRAISEFTKTDRIFAEIEGVGHAFVTGALGFIAKNAGDNLTEVEDSSDRPAKDCRE